MQDVAWTYRTPIPVVLDTTALAEFFARILKQDRDFAVTVYGQKRMGKSISTAELVRQISLINGVEFSIKKDIVFYLKDFYKAMKEAKPYECKILDDFGSEADSKRSMERKSIDLTHFFHTSGTERVGYFITTPTSGWINKDIRERVSTYFIWITSKNTQYGYCRAKVQHIQRNEATGKIYKHNLFLSYNGKVNDKGIGNAIAEWILYPLPKELQEEYLPYRLEKADRNLEKGISNLEEEELLNKSRRWKPDEIIEEILANRDKYVSMSSSGTYKLDRGLIEYDYNLSERKYNIMRSLLIKRLQDEDRKKDEEEAKIQPIASNEAI